MPSAGVYRLLLTGLLFPFGSNTAFVAKRDLITPKDISPGWSYIGCYSDSVQAHTLNGIVKEGDDITNQNCITFCNQNHYIYAGTEYGGQCRCGNSILNGNSNQTESSCSSVCTGNSTQACGGSNRLSLFKSNGTAPAGPFTNPGPGNWSSLGCYVDDQAAHTLSVNIQNDDTNTTVANCVNKCQGAGYSYAGMMYSSECWCDNQIRNNGPTTDGNHTCNMLCSGNGTEVCGGGNRLNLYVNNFTLPSSSSSSAVSTTTTSSPTTSLSASTSGAVSNGAVSSNTATTTMTNSTTSGTTSGTASNTTTNAVVSATDAMNSTMTTTPLSTSSPDAVNKAASSPSNSTNSTTSSIPPSTTPQTDVKPTDAMNSTTTVTTSVSGNSAVQAIADSGTSTTSITTTTTPPSSSTPTTTPSVAANTMDTMNSTTTATTSTMNSTTTATTSTMNSTTTATTSTPAGITTPVQGFANSGNTATGVMSNSTTSSATVTPSTSMSDTTSKGAGVAAASGNSTMTTTSSSTPSTTTQSTTTSTNIACPASNGTIFTATSGKNFLVECYNDHYGGDLSMVYASSLAGCINACDALQGCVAYAWTSQANGNNAPCYMKGSITGSSVNQGVWGGKLLVASATSTTSTTSSVSNAASSTGVNAASNGTSTTATAAATSTAKPTSTILACPSSNGTLYTAASGKNFMVECYNDHYGGDLSQTYVSTLKGCIDACDSLQGCVAYSWVSQANGNSAPCYMKSSIGGNTVNNGVWGGKVVAVTGSTSSQSTASSTGTGGTLSNSSTTSTTASSGAAVSSTTSSNDVSCPANNGTVFKSTSGQTYLIECYNDHYAGDLGPVYASSLAGCINACGSTKTCVAYSWVSQTNGNSAPCYLKNTIGGDNKNTAVWGGKLVVLPDPTSSTTTFVTSSTATNTSLSTSTSVITPISNTTTPVITGGTTSTTNSATTAASNGTATNQYNTTMSAWDTTTSTISNSTTSMASKTTMSNSTITTSTMISTTPSVTTSKDAAWNSTTSSDTNMATSTKNSTTMNTSTMPVVNNSTITSATSQTAAWNSTTSSDKSMATPTMNSTSTVTSLAGNGTTSSSTPQATGWNNTTSLTNSTMVSSLTSTMSATNTSTGWNSTTTTMYSGTTGYPSIANGSTSSNSSTTSATITSGSNSTYTNTTISSTSTSASPTPTGWISIGCYADDVNKRTLMYGMNGNANTQSIEQCTATCQKASYQYAGVEYGGECYCDNVIRNNGPASDGSAQCNMKCNGNATETCGGPDRLNMYKFFGGSATTTSNNVATTTTTPVSSATLPPGWKYSGCYVDGANGRVMAYQQPDSNQQTIENCISTCSGLGYTIAGLEYASQCFCDNFTRNGGALAKSDTECGMACSGNANEKCGDGDRLSIYSNGTVSAYVPPTAQMTNLVGNWTYQGCLTDDADARTFPYRITNMMTNNTANSCLGLCSQFGYGAGGMEFSTECFCGDVTDIANAGATIMPEAQCNMACSGNSSTICGGSERISYYKWTGTPLTSWDYPANAGSYQMLIGGVVIPLITHAGINGKVTFTEKLGTGPPNSTGSYELDLAQINNFTGAWRPLHVKTDVFCSASLTLPDRAGRQINIGGWANDATYGVRLYAPDGSPGVWGKNDWEEDEKSLSLQVGRWYPTAMIMANGSILVVGGEQGSNGAAVPSLELLPKAGGVIYQDYLARTDPYNLYPFLAVLPTGGVLILYYNEARILDENSLTTQRTLPNMPGAVNDFNGGRTYPFEGTAVLMPQHAPYSDPLTVMICGGSTPGPEIALDNCVSLQPEVRGQNWTIERMPSARVISCMTALPDGTYLILNGGQQGRAGFGTGSRPNHNAVLYDPSKPVQHRMSVLANTTIDRLYHSEAILLQDGRVLVSGSDPQDNIHPQEYRVEVFNPPYLNKGIPQPSFTISDKDWTYGSTHTMTVTSSSGGALTASLLGAEASTHGNSMGQRTIFPAVSCSGSSCTVTAPPNAHVCPPGWFQLFLLENGVPSHGVYVRIGGDPGMLGNWPANNPNFHPPGMGAAF